MHARTRTTLAVSLALTALLASCSTGESQQAVQPSTTQSAGGSQQPAAEAGESREIANGYFRIQLPVGWQMREIDNEFHQYNPDSATSLEFTNPDGEVMAALRTGSEPVPDEGVPSQPEDNVLIDGQALDPTEGPHFSFVASGADPDTALIALGNASPDQQARFDTSPVPFNYQGGSAIFERRIGPETQLKDVDAKLRGQERMRAYTETEDYQQLKSLMLSFEQLKHIEGEPPQSPTSTPSGTVEPESEAPAG